MSQKVIYTCNNCEITIGAKPHISLYLNGSSATGIAIPPRTKGNAGSSWRLDTMNTGLYHFCNGKCISEYFTKMIKEATKQ